MIQFTKEAWDHYLYWQNTDKTNIKKINQLIKECLRHPYEGTGKPEPLKRNLSGFWSRRISGEHRFVYCFEKGVLYIASCRFHYDE